jgi:hypothetical protein
MERLTVEAPSLAAFSAHLAAMPHETRANVTATEHGEPWATVTISPLTDTRRSVFPNYLQSTAVGDSRKRGQCGVSFTDNPAERSHALAVVIERARRMAKL